MLGFLNNINSSFSHISFFYHFIPTVKLFKKTVALVEMLATWASSPFFYPYVPLSLVSSCSVFVLERGPLLCLCPWKWCLCPGFSPQMTRLSGCSVTPASTTFKLKKKKTIINSVFFWILSKMQIKRQGKYQLFLVIIITNWYFVCISLLSDISVSQA